MRYKITDNFYLDEFVQRETQERFGLNAQRYIRKEIVMATQFIRTMSGLPITINNWANGGAYKESGLRDFNTSTGAKYSAHKFGAAADLKIGNLTSHEMVELLINYESDLLEYGICRYENPDATKGRRRDWLHIDALWTGKNELIMVNP